MARPDNNKGKRSSIFHTILQVSFFLAWLLCTGLAGYFVGSGTAIVQDASPCASGTQPLEQQPDVQTENAEPEPCPQVSQDSADILNELRSSWSCSQAKYNASLPREHILKVNLDKTKWKTVMTIEPHTFYEKYLTQYPRDMLISDPVVLFSHKPVASFAQAAEECKVVDVAIVPAAEGTCVAITETFHDVASYHMLHADKNEESGQFQLSSNPVAGRHIPEEPAYAAARLLLMEYFKHNTAVANAVKKAGLPKTDTKFLVAVVLFTIQDIELFANSLASFTAAGGDKNDVVIFLATGEAQSSVSHLGVKRIVMLPMLHQSMSTMDEKTVSHLQHRHFQQAWLAFTVADGGHPVLWQSPATIWLASPDKLRKSVAGLPPVDTLWSFRGRSDPRGSPFFSSFDFFWNNAKERSVHLLHEVMLHADLLVAWKSLDAVTGYRLAENNARYGTSVRMFPPLDVLHSNVVNGDISSLATTVKSADKPIVLVISHELVVSTDIKESLRIAGLWFMK